MRARLVKKAIASHIALNPETQQQMIAGEMEVDLVPQGTLIERNRAGGFGLGGILTRDGLLSCHRWRGADPVVSAASTAIPPPLTSDADAGQRATDRRRAAMSKIP